MTVYIRPNGDDENDGSESAPVKSPKRAIAIANRNKDQEINLLTTDWARINRELGAEEDEFPQGGGYEEPGRAMQRPLTRGEAEIFDTRVAAGPRVPSWIVALFDRIFLRFQCWRGVLITGDMDTALRNRSLARAQPLNLCCVPVS
jgi:hypothetical protein